MGARRERLDQSAVIDAAERIVDAGGHAQLTMTALAKDLGVRVPSLYSHVANLETLLSLVQNRAIAELGSDLQRAAMGRAGHAGVRGLAAALRSFALRHPGRYALALSAPIDRPGMQLASRTAEEAFGAVMASMGAELSNELAALTLSPLHGALTLERNGLFPSGEVDIDAVYERAIDQVIYAIEVSTASQAPI